MSLPEPTMVWLDMETTGLDAHKDAPLEIGVILTDDWGKEIASTKTLVWDDSERYQHAMRRGKANEFVDAMHIKSGLWKDLQYHATLNRWEAQRKIIEFLQNWNVQPGELPMCGNSIGSLDRPFTILHFPHLNEFLHYRNVDMSTVKELCKRLNPELYMQLIPIIGTKADAEHRVLSDCRASIREYQCYIDEFLIVGDD